MASWSTIGFTRGGSHATSLVAIREHSVNRRATSSSSLSADAAIFRNRIDGSRVAVGENVVRHFRSSVYRKECHESEIGCSEGELSETARTGWLSFARLEIIDMLGRSLAFLLFDTLEIIDN